MSEHYEFAAEQAEPADTSKTTGCNNVGCGFNVGCFCTATGTKCYGYLEPPNE